MAASYREHRAADNESAPWNGWWQQRIRISHEILLAGDPIGTVHIVSDLRILHARFQKYTIIALLVLLFSLLVALALSTRLQQMISDAALHLAQVTRRVARERNYGVRAEQLGQDEFGTLAQGFNAMLDQIQQRDEQLEEQVAQRTGELLEANEQLAHQAYHDALTQLPNRALFDDRLNQAVARSARADEIFAVLFLDIDDSKLINDTLGHEVRRSNPGQRGETSEALRSSGRYAGTIGRR